MARESLCGGLRTKAVVALGNPDRGDDGVALRVLLGLPTQENVDFLVSLKTGLDLAMQLVNYDKVLVIDAAPSLPPGTISFSQGAPEKARGYLHGLGLGEALQVLREMGLKVPVVWVLAIGVPPLLPFHRGLSEVVEKAVPKAKEVVEAWLRNSE